MEILDAGATVEFLEAQQLAHGRRLLPEVARLWGPVLGPGRMLGVRVDGELVAGGTTVPAAVSLPGPGLAPTAFMGNLITVPAARGRGHARRVLHAQFRDNRRLGQAFAVFTVTPSARRLHDASGSVVVVHRRSCVVNSGERAAVGEAQDVASLTPCDESLYRPHANPLRDALLEQGRRWAGVLVPSDDWLAAYLRTEIEYGPVKYQMLRTAAGSGSAFALLATHDDRVVVEIATPRDLAGWPRLLRTVLAVLPTARVEFRNLPLSFSPTLALSAAAPVLSERIEPSLWCRVLDPAAALVLRRYERRAGSLRLGVRDRVLPENDGVYEVSVDADGSAVCARTTRAAELTVDIGVVALLLFGHASPSVLHLNGAVQVESATALERADSIFRPARNGWNPFTM